MPQTMHGVPQVGTKCSPVWGSQRTCSVGTFSSTCPCVVPLKHAVAMRKQENMPRECPIPRCSASPWVLNIKIHLARCHATVAPNTVDLTEWVVVSKDDEEKKRGEPKKSPW